MKKINRCLFFSMLLLSCMASFAQIPTNNPYRERYAATMPAAPFHWTDSIRWNIVVDIQNYSGLVSRIDDPGEEDPAILQNDWLPAFTAAQNALVASGGGVIYFPMLPQRYDGEGGIDPGMDSAYFFSDHIRLKNNVILRGPTPPDLDGRNVTFAPPSYIEFPRYRGGTSVSVDNNTSFKEITTAGPDFRNIGIVYLDVNRGRFAAHPSFTRIFPGGFGIANEKPRNVLILGMRSNNVAIPDTSVPRDLPSIPAAIDMLAKRWPWRFAANVDVYVAANCIIAGCRFNDYLNNTGRGDLRRILDNSFPQTFYVPNSAGGIYCFPTPEQAKFDYNAHYGILLNRFKKTGYNYWLGFNSNATPDLEPELFATGNVVQDNWIFKNMRAAIVAAGYGLVISGNICKDDSTKERYINANGTVCLAQVYPSDNTPTFENRGIDFTGWNVLIDNNTVEAFRHKLKPSNNYTADGEGWYCQAIASSTVRGLTISNNRFIGSKSGFCGAISNTTSNKAFNGISFTTNIQNVKIINNDNGGIPLRIETLGIPISNYTIQGLTISGNTNVHSIRVKATGCGDSAFVFNNSKGGTNPSCGLPDLELDCFVSLNSNLSLRNVNTNSGFSTLANSATRSGCANVCSNPPLCDFPNVNLVSWERAGGPGPLSLGDQLVISYNYSLDPVCTPDSIVLYHGVGIKVEKVDDSNLIPGSGTVVFTNYTFNANPDYIYAIIYKNSGAQSTFKQSLFAQIAKGYPTLSTSSLSSPTIRMYPNPSSKILNFETEGLSGTGTVHIYDLTGRALIKKEIPMGQSSADVSTLAKGTYLVQFRINNQNEVKKLLID